MEEHPLWPVLINITLMQKKRMKSLHRYRNPSYNYYCNFYMNLYLCLIVCSSLTNFVNVATYVYD